MAHPYALTDRIGTRATMGLIVLQTDETLESEFRYFFTSEDIAIYVSRVPSGADVTPETLREMEAEIPQAAGLLPPSLSYDVIGYGCTSGATMIGPDRVTELVKGAAQVETVTNPLTAVIAGLAHLKARRVAMLTPYVESVTGPMRDALMAAGFEIASCVSFDEAEEAKVARIDPASVRETAIAAGCGTDADAVFLSCTNLRTKGVIEEIETELGLPVIASNQALAWHMARSAGIGADRPIGRLMRG